MSHPEYEAASCTGKVRFASHAAAMRVQHRRSKDREKGRGDQKPYRCRTCHGWHIGRTAAERPKHEWRRWKERYEG